MKLITNFTFVLVFFGGGFPPLHAQTLNKAVDLRVSPTADAKLLKNLPVGTALKLIKREGFWVEVDASGIKGWLKLSDVSMSQGATSGIGALDTGRTSKGNIVSTSAARGLTAKELVSAKPDLVELEHLKSLSISAQEAQQFAQAAGLKSRTVLLLKAPASSPSGKSKKIVTGKDGKDKKSKDDDDDQDDD